MKTPKRSAQDDITSNHVINEDIDSSDRKRWEQFDRKLWFPMQPNARIEPASIVSQFETQNVHPYLAHYNDNLNQNFYLTVTFRGC